MKKIDNKTKKAIGKKLLIAGVVCVIAALSIFIYNTVMDISAGNFTSSVLEEIKNQETEKISASKNFYEEEKAAASVQGYNFMGYISIPKLLLELPVMSDWNYDKLNISPCRYSGSFLTRDLVVAAHNYSSHFGNLYKLNKGDEIRFKEPNGRVHYYEVALTDTLEPVEINKMTSGEYALSLFTCTWTGTARVTVRCNEKT